MDTRPQARCVRTDRRREDQRPGLPRRRRRRPVVALQFFRQQRCEATARSRTSGCHRAQLRTRRTRGQGRSCRTSRPHRRSTRATGCSTSAEHRQPMRQHVPTRGPSSYASSVCSDSSLSPRTSGESLAAWASVLSPVACRRRGRRPWRRRTRTPTVTGRSVTAASLASPIRVVWRAWAWLSRAAPELAANGDTSGIEAQAYGEGVRTVLPRVLPQPGGGP